MPLGVASFGLWVSASNAVTWSLLHADNAVIGFFFGEQTLGIYALGLKLATIVPGMFTGPVSTVAFPQFARLKAQGPAAVGAHLLWASSPGCLGRTGVAWVALVAPSSCRRSTEPAGPGFRWSSSCSRWRSDEQPLVDHGAGFPGHRLPAGLAPGGPSNLLVRWSRCRWSRLPAGGAVVVRAAAAVL